jgi:interleukin-1 receptor-associated kinase 1
VGTYLLLLHAGGKLVMFQSGVIVPSSREMFRAISRVRKRDIVGEGAYGVVYKLVLKDDSVFAVKKLKQCLENQRSFENELNTLATVKHRNLVRLRGFCTAPQSKLLIYDFLPNGSVDELLHGKYSSTLHTLILHKIIKYSSQYCMNVN